MSYWTQLTRGLSEDHQVVLGKLLELEQATAAMADGDASAQSEQAVEDAIASLQQEIPPHFNKEENVLFPPLQDLGGRWAALLAVILAEHQGLHQLRASLVAAHRGDDHRRRDWADVRRKADDLILVLRRHINKEDTMIFPMAEKDLQ